MLFLGDDMLMVLNEKPNTTNLRESIKARHNMLSKEQTSTVCGEFCHKLVGNREGQAHMVPDIEHLIYRFEVPNHMAQPTLDDLKTRAMSYCMELGDIRLTREVT